MTVKCLVEDEIPLKEGFTPEHGLSLLITIKDRKILFDTGSSGVFIQNAKKMGESLEDVDIAVLSHGHYDHGGGIKEFLKINGRALIYANKDVFGEYYHGREKYVGLLRSLKDTGRFKFIGDEEEIDGGLELKTFNGRIKGPENACPGFYEKRGDGFYPDAFLHETYLIITENGKKTVFGGCAHKGILNIVALTSPDVYFGGFHLKDIDVSSLEGQRYLKNICIGLNGKGTVYYTCHCTGMRQYEFLKKYLKGSLHYIRTGETAEV